MNNIEKRVYEFVCENNLIDKGERIIVGLSGGADSICLLHVLYKLRDKLNLKITAIHINHMIRGEEALRDENHAVDFCKSLDIDVIVERIDVPQLAKDKKMSEEEAGRVARYTTFYKYKNKIGAHKIAVAHNKNDNAETVIMNIIRGSGLSGLKGIDIKRDDIIRPIMVLGRHEIEDYCKLYNLVYVTDSTNNETIYTRNKVRLKLIKQIDDIFNADIIAKINQMTNLLKDDNLYIEENAKKAFLDCSDMSLGNKVIIDLRKFITYHKAIQRKVLREAILKIKKDINRIEYKHIESMLELAIYGKTGKIIELPQNIRVYKDYNRLKVYFGNDIEDKVLNVDISIDNKRVSYIKLDDNFDIELQPIDRRTKLNTSDMYTKYFDYDKLKPNIAIRKREDGDIFKPLNSNGTKKLKKYFIDKKVSKLERDKLYLIAKGKDIVWILEDKISDNFKVTQDTKNIIRITFIRKNGRTFKEGTV